MSDAERGPAGDDGLPPESAEELYETAPCGYVSARPDGTITRVNGTFLAWTGYARDELVGRRRLQDLLAIGYRIYYETHLAPLLQMQGFVREVAVDVLRKDRSALPALLNATLLRSPEGAPRLVRATVFDATERRGYERELLLARKRAEEAAQAKADFLSTMSHEIRTPLGAVLGAAQLLAMTSPTPQQQKYIRILKSSADSLLRLVNDILDFSKIEAGKVTLEERPLDLRQLVGDLAAAQGPRAEEKGVEFRAEVDPRLPEALLGDPVKIGQVLTNLVGNAIKFTTRGSVVVAVRVGALTPERASVDFSVRDTGIGIAPDRVAAIFEEFTQASYDVGMRYGGTGLGLAICRKLLALYGAQMSVESEVGRGSTFSFTLDLRVAPGSVVEAPDRDAHQEAVRGLKVLVVDDNEVNVYVLTDMLRRWGVAFDTASGGRAAVERVAAGDYDLVLTDLRMPGMDGFEAARAIRAMPGERFATLPIIAVSASVRIGQEGQLAAAGLTDFVGKPIDADTLLATMARHAKARGRV